MLSNEKDSTDPSSDFKRPYDKLKAVDLSTSDLVKEPTFSIRDYVFFTRNNVNKDFVNNWPFSQNNLQLCLNHGVKDLLPPFQSPDLVRNLPRTQGSVESVLVDNDTRFDSINELSDSSNHFDPNLFVSEANNELGSTTATLYSSKTLNELSKVSKVVVTKPSVKKCRLIMKYSNIPHLKTKETTTLNAPMSSETAAVCPVCRTFSSSSNTTLNAHIDQCLSGDYTTKTVTYTKINRHKIKPRKIRLMVDIYKTAPHCTLEELDRRNGSNWASNSTCSSPEVEISADPKGLRLNVKETTSGDGSVYVDSNGTKVRILSKFSNPSNSKAVDTSQTRKLLKGGEKSLGLLAKKIEKMKNQIQKQQKSSSLDKYGKKISNGQDGIISHKEIDKKDECMEKQHKASNQVNLTETVARSKKMGLMKKINGADDKRNSRERVNGNSLAKRSLSFLATNSHVKKLSDLEFPSSDKRPLKIRKTHAGNDDNWVSNPITSSVDRSLLSKTRKFSSLSKKLSSPSHVSALNSRFSRKKKVFTTSDSDEEETPSQSRDYLHNVTEGDTSSEESYDRNVVLEVRNCSRESIVSREEEVEDIALRNSQSTSMRSNNEPDSWNENVSLMLGSVVGRRTSDNVEQLSEVAVGGQFTRFSDSMEAGFISSPVRFIYEAATNLTSGQEIFPERIENVGVMVDQIQIPGPPGSFLPSPRHMDSDDLQGNSSLTSTRVHSHDDHQDFADQSSESHASDTSTVSNCNILRSCSKPLEKLHVGPPTNMEISASTVAANVMETCPPKTKLNIALTEIPSPNHPCYCSRKEVLLQNVASNYQNLPLLLRRTMDNGTMDRSNSSSRVINAVQGDDCTKSVAGIASSSVYNDNEKSVSPAPSTPVLRLMGKNLMVINKDESDMHLDLNHSISNPGLHHSNDALSKLNGNYKHSTTPQATTSASNLTGLMDQSAARDFTAHMGFIGGVCMSKSDHRNTSPYCETQEYVYGRPVVNRSLADSSGLVQRPHGANSELAKWNWTLETSNGPLAALNTRSFSGALFRSE